MFSRYRGYAVTVRVRVEAARRVGTPGIGRGGRGRIGVEIDRDVVDLDRIAAGTVDAAGRNANLRAEVERIDLIAVDRDVDRGRKRIDHRIDRWQRDQRDQPDRVCFFPLFGVARHVDRIDRQRE